MDLFKHIRTIERAKARIASTSEKLVSELDQLCREADLLHDNEYVSHYSHKYGGAVGISVRGCHHLPKWYKLDWVLEEINK